MSKFEAEKRDFEGMGNYLGKKRRNFNISNKCWYLMHELSLELGLYHNAVIELAVRHFYQQTMGTPDRIRYTPERITK